MEDKGLRVHMDKTKILVCYAKPVQSGKPSGKWPCGVCGKGVGQKASILCTQCGKWMHKRCSGVKGSLESCKNFQIVRKMSKCSSQCSGDCQIARQRVLGASSMELMPILTMRETALKVKGKIYQACVQCVMRYGSETWVMKVEDTQKLKRTEASMSADGCVASL